MSMSVRVDMLQSCRNPYLSQKQHHLFDETGKTFLTRQRNLTSLPSTMLVSMPRTAKTNCCKYHLSSTLLKFRKGWHKGQSSVSWTKVQLSRVAEAGPSGAMTPSLHGSWGDTTRSCMYQQWMVQIRQNLWPEFIAAIVLVLQPSGLLLPVGNGW